MSLIVGVGSMVSGIDTRRHFGISPSFSGKSVWDLDIDGPLNLTTPGTWIITPLSNFLAKVEVGGGCGQGSVGNTGGQSASGGTSSIGSLSATGGGGARAVNQLNFPTTGGSVGSGGSGSGGDLNQSGASGTSGSGSPNFGLGGSSPGGFTGSGGGGSNPGGGDPGYGGGGGGKTTKNQMPFDSILTAIVGSTGATSGRILIT